jgi:hypothetical protein
MKRVKAILGAQAERDRIISSLNKKIKSNDWMSLVVGGTDPEVITSMTESDRRSVLEQATSVCRGMENQSMAVANSISKTWRDCCEQTASEQKQFKWTTLAEWFRLFNHGTPINEDLKRFPVSMRGEVLDAKLMSPFHAEFGDEGLTMKFKSWAKVNLEGLTILRATKYINQELCSDIQCDHAVNMGIEFPVSPATVSRWMKACGFI